MFGDLRNAFQWGGGMGPFVCMIAGVFISYIVVMEPIQYKVTIFFFFSVVEFEIVIVFNRGKKDFVAQKGLFFSPEKGVYTYTCIHVLIEMRYILYL